MNAGHPTGRLNGYAAYKPSGVEWLGDVPVHWEVRPGRAAFQEVIERDNPEEQMLSVTIARGVIAQETLLQDGSQKDSSRLDKSDYKLVCPGDIVYNKMRAWQGAVGMSSFRGIVSPAYVVQRPRCGSQPSYFHHLMRLPAFATEAERWSYGIASDMWSLRPEHFKMIQFPLPPLPEQHAIVRYLDYVDRRIRRYVAAKRRLIVLLEEERQAVINQAVTRGLDPHVRLRPSGVEWLGDMPEHWEVRRLKSLGHIRYGLGQPPRESAEGLPLIRATNVERGRIIEKGLIRVDPSDVPIGRDALLRAQEIIVVRSGAYTADSAIIPPVYEGAVAGYDLVVTATGCLSQFVAWALLSTYLRDVQLITASSRAAQPHLNAEELGASTLLVPPIYEQSAIVAHLDKATAEIDAAIAPARRQVELVEEYRTRLIADVVTGKLDVREVAAQLPDEAEDHEPVGEGWLQENGLAEAIHDAEEEPATAEEVTT